MRQCLIRKEVEEAVAFLKEHLYAPDFGQLDSWLITDKALRNQLEAQSIEYQDNLTEIQLLKAQIVNREKEVDTMMAQRNLAEDKLALIELRERGYLSELDDYARTVLNLRSRVKACEAEHGLHRVQS